MRYYEATMSTNGTSIEENGRTCNFGTINDFFDYANKNGLNITEEVQNCQNLCLLTYGVGNPDLSGIRHIVNTSGCSSAIEQLSWAFMEPGEGMLLGKPYYGTFIADISVRPSAVVIPVNFGKVNPLSPEAISQYKKAVTDFEFSTGNHVPAVMLCHPHNPLGRCYPRSAIIDLVKMCQAHQMHLISDKIYALAGVE
ncbi:hypothetical protein CNMCM8694_007396 [Aspergillus lentulus]|nr:hypothetical protein CNMCM8060_007659 [Aspergillus lentulus]KAF4194479.1 hypothetical protein CNMCM8694_007396 [Aspergillus lentulus]